MVTRSGSQTQPGAAEFDIHVLAFPAASTRTVQGLRELFGLDAQSAQHIIASVPTILRQRVPAAEAEACAQALRKLGARVVLEPPQGREPPPPPAAAYLQHTAHWPGAGRPANDSLPRPVARAPAADLEYDVLSALGAALDGDAQDPGIPTPRELAQRLSLEQLEEPMPMSETTSALKGRQEELDLGGRGSREQAPLELEGERTETKRKPAAPTAPRRQAESPAPEREPPTSTTQPRQATAPTGASRAAVVERRAPQAPPSRNIPLLQLLAACGVFAVGYWLDSSVLYGSAGWTSVVLHGLALQQLILGARGLLT